MKHLRLITVLALSLMLITGCSEGNEDTTATAMEGDSVTATPKTDPEQLKKEIQEQETAWSKADNARDLDALAAFYADDAISLEADQPALMGNAAIKKDLEASLAKRPAGSTLSYEVVDAYGDDNHVTEVGKTTRMDSTGKVTSTGKYMAIWEKRDGKWICIRDIGNEDTKKK